MAKRKPVDERRFYSKEEQEYILSKTGGKCAHCGKSLTIQTMQKDHSIPWSKGGASDVENIVPLCKECNSEKADNIYVPIRYFFYVKKPILRKMQDYFSEYLENVDYLYAGNLFPMDYLTYTNPIPMNIKRKIVYVPKRLIYKKAVYSDLDKIYEFFLKYNEAYPLFQGISDMLDVKRELKEILSYTFSYGTILFTEKSNGSIACVILSSMEIESVSVDSKVGVEYKNQRIIQPTVRFQFFIDKDIKLYPIYHGEKVEYSKKLSNTCMYCAPFPYIIDEFFSYLSLNSAVVSVCITGCNSDPRSEYVLKSVVDRKPPFRNKDYNLLVQEEENVLYTSILVYDHELSLLYNKDSQAFEKAKREGIFNGSELLYNRMKEANLLHRWLRVKGFKGCIFLHQLPSKLGMSYYDAHKYICENL